MSTLPATHPSDPAPAGPATPTRGESWVRLLAITVTVVAAVDVVFMGLIGEVVPPLLVGVVLTAVGLGILRRWRRTGIVWLGLVSLIMLGGSLEPAGVHLGAPSSGIDFVHSVVAILGRGLALVAAVGALRGAGATSARRLGLVATALGALTLVTGTVATLATSGSDPASGDVEVAIEASAFEEVMTVPQGGTLFVDNRDLFRHTFTVEGTDIDVDLPALQGARVTVDLAPGDYAVICALPAHDFMTGTLQVR
jgi:plastocyanin